MEQNPLLSLLLNGQAAEAWKQYISLPEPTPEEDRWAGLALRHLGQGTAAKNMLLRAIARGCVHANIELGGFYLAMNDCDLAEKALSALTHLSLNPFDSALYHYMQALLKDRNGSLQDAISSAEQGWAAAFGLTGPTEKVRSSIAGLLAELYVRMGMDLVAREYYDACLDLAPESRKAEILSSRALSYAYLGRHQDAMQDHQQGQQWQSGVSQAVQQNIHYQSGLMFRCLGHLPEAIKALAATDVQHKENQDYNIHFYAQVYLSALHLELGQESVARSHLARVRPLAKSKLARMTFFFREGALMSRSNPGIGLKLLQEAAVGLHELQAYRQLLWCLLHQSETFLRLGQSNEALEALSQVTDLRHQLGNPHLALVELRALPLTRELLKTLPEDHYVSILNQDCLQAEAPRVTVKTVHIVSLGRGRVQLDEGQARFTIGRAIEVLCYLVLNPNSTLEDILLDLFPDQDPKLAKNYFHQARYDIERATHDISVPYDKTSRTYGVKLQEVQLEWDLLQLQQSIQEHNPERFFEVLSRAQGEFLLDLDSEWIEAMRLEWQDSILTFGLQTVQGWWQEGQLDRCLQGLAVLLKLDPLNEELHQLCLRCTLQQQGQQGLKSCWRQVVSAYSREGLDPPLPLQKWVQQQLVQSS